MNLVDKVALVTGGAGGIGKEIVRELLKNGVKGVCIVDINVQPGEDVQNEFTELYGKNKIIFMKADVTNESEFEESIQQTIKICSRLDIIVNSAGIGNNEDYVSEVNVNLISTIRGTLLGCKYLRKDRGGNGGTILNIASVEGLDVLAPFPVYVATKFGAVGFVRCIGDDYHYTKMGVSIMALCPGYTETEFISNFALSMDKDMMLHLMKTFPTLQRQTPQSVGLAAIYVLKEGQSGSVWVIEGSKLSSVAFPSLESMKTFVNNMDPMNNSKL